MQFMNNPLFTVFIAAALVGCLLLTFSVMQRATRASFFDLDKTYIVIGSLMSSSLVFQLLDISVPDDTYMRLLIVGDTGKFVWPFTIQASMWFAFILFMFIYLYRIFLDESVKDAPTSYDEKRAHYDAKLETLNFLSWTIPTIGFIGTVVGLMDSLDVISSSTDLISDMRDGLMTEVLKGLAVAFSTTILGLILNICCMLCYSNLAKDYLKRCTHNG